MESIKTIAHIQSYFPSKFGIPRQSGMIETLRASVVFEPEYRNPDALRGLKEFSHIWLIWGFSEAERDRWSPTVRPPRLGGNTRVGVFATRSPYRPNPLGLSSVRIEGISVHPVKGHVIHVLGADIMDGTPIYDIKPYIPYTDCHADAIGGFASDPPCMSLEVIIDDRLLKILPEGIRNTLRDVLAHDPRPAYQKEPDRIYGMEFAGFEIKFFVDGSILTVTKIVKIEQ